MVFRCILVWPDGTIETPYMTEYGINRTMNMCSGPGAFPTCYNKDLYIINEEDSSCNGSILWQHKGSDLMLNAVWPRKWDSTEDNYYYPNKGDHFYICRVTPNYEFIDVTDEDIRETTEYLNLWR